MINLVISFIYPFLYFYSFINQYKVIQYHHYELEKYFKQKKFKILFILILSAFVFLLSYVVSYFSKMMLSVLLVVLTNCFMSEKGILKLTNRVKRCLSIYFLFSFFVALLFKNKTILFSLNSFVFFICLFTTHLVSCFIEFLIMRSYIKDAKRIVKDVKIIGITGSYGKTSCKNIIYDMISGFVSVSKTPKSYNNQVGIVKSIRECVSEDDDYFICEYGVDKKGGMNKLLRIVKPNVSLITEIGPQHILTFKNIDNIKNEKLKIAKILSKQETCVVNNDNIYLREEIKNLKCNVITYGIKNKSDIMAKNIIVNTYGSSFDLFINNRKFKNIKICLLGEHNILNVLGCIGVLKSIGIDLKKIDGLVMKIKPIEHRLELKRIQGIKVIDDGFNSNEVGFKNAIDILSMMQEEKFIITPGIIEQGENSEKVNYELGKYMAKKIDFAILVEKNAYSLKKGLIDGGFAEGRILIKEDFLKAWEYVKSIANDEKIFLIENDLPSIYLR